MLHRQTVQKSLVLAAVQNLRGHVTADEVYDYIHNVHPSVGKGTVYRNLNLLADEKQIRRIAISDGPDRFDFTLADHYHVKCICCGKVSDVDMDVLPDLCGQIRDTHGMKFLGYELLFHGVCPECQEEERSEKDESYNNV